MFAVYYMYLQKNLKEDVLPLYFQAQGSLEHGSRAFALHLLSYHTFHTACLHATSPQSPF